MEMTNENVHVTAVSWLIYPSILGLTPILTTKPCVSSNHPPLSSWDPSSSLPRRKCPEGWFFSRAETSQLRSDAPEMQTAPWTQGNLLTLTGFHVLSSQKASLGYTG